MKFNNNVVKDLAYQEMIFNKLLEQGSRFDAFFRILILLTMFYKVAQEQEDILFQAS